MSNWLFCPVPRDLRSGGEGGGGCSVLSAYIDRACKYSIRPDRHAIRRTAYLVGVLSSSHSPWPGEAALERRPRVPPFPSLPLPVTPAPHKSRGPGPSRIHKKHKAARSASAGPIHSHSQPDEESAPKLMGQNPSRKSVSAWLRVLR